MDEYTKKWWAQSKIRTDEYERLLNAVDQNDLDTIRTYIASGKLSSIDGAINGETLLHRATKQKQVACMQLLIDAGANVNAITMSQKETPLHILIRNSDFLTETPNQQLNMDCFHLLLNHKADLNLKDNFGYTPLHLAVHHGYELYVRDLLKAGANVQTKNNLTEFSPLHTASEQGNLLIVQMLVDYGSDIEAKTLFGVTASYLAMRNNHHDVVCYLKDMNELPIKSAMDWD